MYAREGVELDRATLADWVGQAVFRLAPLAEAIARHVLNGAVLHADDTTIPVLAPGLGRTMAPAGHFDQRRVVARPRRFIEFAEASVAIGVKKASAGTEQRFGMCRLAVRRIAIERRGRYTRSPRALVAHDHPQSSGSGCTS